MDKKKIHHREWDAGNLTFETSYVVVLQARTSKGWGESSRETTRTIKRMGE